MASRKETMAAKRLKGARKANAKGKAKLAVDKVVDNELKTCREQLEQLLKSPCPGCGYVRPPVTP